MKIEKVPISKIHPNPMNPRIIKDDKYQALLQSIKDFPEMAEAREIVVNLDYMILGGNMRYEAEKEAGWTETTIKVVDWTAEKQAEFIAKDNIGYGEWDYGELANQYELDTLQMWGMDLPKSMLDGDDDKKDDKSAKHVLTVEFDDEATMQELFIELQDRDFKCKTSTS